MPDDTQELKIKVTADTKDAQQAFTGLKEVVGDLAPEFQDAGDGFRTMYDPELLGIVNGTNDAIQETEKVVADTGTQVEATGLKFTELRSKLELARWAINAVTGAFKDVYKAGREGADLIGGDVAAAYDEFDQNIIDLENSMKSAVATGLLPYIEATNRGLEVQNELNDSLARGEISFIEHRLAMVQADQGLDSYIESVDGTTDAVEDQAEAHAKAMEAAQLFVYQLQLIDEDSESWDHALQVTAGILESEVNAALETAEGLVGNVVSGFRELGLVGDQWELALINLKEAQGLLNAEQADSERLMLALEIAIKNGLVPNVYDLQAALLDGILTEEEFARLLGETETAANEAGGEVEFLATQAERLDGSYHANITITITGADLLAAAADDLAAMQDASQGVDYSGNNTNTNDYGPGNSGASGGVDPTEKMMNPGFMGGGTVNLVIDGQIIGQIAAERLGAMLQQARTSGAQYAGM